MVLSENGAALAGIEVALFEVMVACAIGCIKKQFLLVSIYLGAGSVRIGTANDRVKYFANQ